MNTFKHDPMVVYVADAYCGWCWGFGDRMAEFEAANRHRVPFTVISGGLFMGERVQPISAYPYIPEANARIAKLTGARFGDGYQRALQAGVIAMNSADAGAALAVLRQQAPDRAVRLFHALQAAFYTDGRSLSDPATIKAIADAEGLDADTALRQLSDGSAAAMAQGDFTQARALGVDAYPTLLFVDKRGAQKLPATGSTLQMMNQHLDAMLG